MNPRQAMPINSPKIINAWCSYDIANSAYNLSISSVLFPIYYQLVTVKAFGSEMVPFWGFTVRNTVLYEYAIAFGYLIIIFLTLSLSGIADTGGLRKRFMQFFTILGSLSCIGLSAFTGENITLGILLPVLAVIGFAGSLVYYNSFLPIIATADRHDRISARGFMYGYGGSVILLIFNIITLQNYAWFGFENEIEAIRFSFVLVGVWWIGIAQFAFYYLRETRQNVVLSKSIISRGFEEVKSVFAKIEHDSVMYFFLIAFFFLSMGVQTIMIVAPLFGSAELGISSTKLIMTILIIQLVAIIGAFLFGRISTKYGSKRSLMIMLMIWILICIAGYLVRTEYEFYSLAAVVGLVMGGIQSQARSTWSKMIPADTNDTASYFSIYDSTEKLAITIGMLSFGFIEHLTGSMRNSTLLLSVFFVLSLSILASVKFKKN